MTHTRAATVTGTTRTWTRAPTRLIRVTVPTPGVLPAPRTFPPARHRAPGRSAACRRARGSRRGPPVAGHETRISTTARGCAPRKRRPASGGLGRARALGGHARAERVVRVRCLTPRSFRTNSIFPLADTARARKTSMVPSLAVRTLAADGTRTVGRAPRRGRARRVRGSLTVPAARSTRAGTPGRSTTARASSTPVRVTTDTVRDPVSTGPVGLVGLVGVLNGRVLESRVLDNRARGNPASTGQGSRGLDRIGKPPLGQARTVQGPTSTGPGRHSTVQERRTVQGRDSTVQGPHSTVQGRDSTAPEDSLADRTQAATPTALRATATARGAHSTAQARTCQVTAHQARDGARGNGPAGGQRVPGQRDPDRWDPDLPARGTTSSPGRASTGPHPVLVSTGPASGDQARLLVRAGRVSDQVRDSSGQAAARAGSARRRATACGQGRGHATPARGRPPAAL